MSLPAVYKKSLKLDVEDVWTGLFTYWLLEDCSERGIVLELGHKAKSEFHQLLPALQERNRRMVGPGQAEWNHACELCCWVQTLDDGTRSKSLI